ncbi:MAG: peptidoglycan glycosyltransferase [Lachnospiraceae bacterium]|nr:peptidoglycan glycosyltransferase [Lachnospiraceae bacterium]
MSNRRRLKRDSRASREERRKREHREKRKLFRSMQQKLIIFFAFVVAALVGLGFRVAYLSHAKGTEYSKQVLMQQRYDSRTLPYKRGEILDANGTKLAYSEKVYNLILDANEITESRKEDALTETMSALSKCFQVDTIELTQYIKENPNSQYYVVKKRIPYEEVDPFLSAKEENASICGVWFEEEYKRQYPNNTLASSVIGFTGTDNNGTYGLEEFYNSTLNGSNGREYGYLSEESTLERTTIPAQDGNTLVTSLDANLQAIVEKYMLEFAAEHRGEYREGEDGVKNMGVIMMNPKTGEIMAMADYPSFDLNDPKNLSTFLSEEEISAMDDKATYDYLNRLWRNYCISDTYEPGSVAKSLTVAAGLDSGKLKGNETYFCGGKMNVSGHEIKCHNHAGHGMVDLSGALEKSCNVALMQIGEQEGKDTLMQYLYNFNIGLKTNVDLSGEARTNTLVYNPENMVASDLAISTFGQGYNVTMIQMISAFCSVINGGKYYEPHVVTQIRDSMGTTIKKIEPRVLKQTISATTSDTMREYLTNVCITGTGVTAVPAGYEIGGKTGTAEKQPRGTGNYVMSFMGFAPADDPQVVIYCVIDEPNVADQPHSTFAQEVVKKILTEALPYLHIYRTRELTEEETEELSSLNLLENPGEPEGEEGQESDAEAESQDGESEGQEGEGDPEGEKKPGSDFAIDPETGYPIDPDTGELLNPNSYSPVDPTSSDLDGLEGVKNDPSQTTDQQGYEPSTNNNDSNSSGVGAGSSIGGDSVDIQYNPDSLRGGNSESSDFGAGAGF